MEPLLPDLLDDVPLDVRRIVRRSFHAFRHVALQYANTFSCMVVVSFGLIAYPN
jgi:hypothetical protein